MEKKNSVFKVVLCLVLVFVIGAGILTGVNSFTAPIIEYKTAELAAQAALEANGAMLEMLPGSTGFETIYSIDEPDAYGMTVPEQVTGIYADVLGAGYVITLATADQYSEGPMLISMAVDAEGKIANIAIDEYYDSKDIRENDYLSTYVGQNSTLADVGLVSGATFSSTAFKEAVSAGFEALSANGLMAAAEKSDEQLLSELISFVFPGAVNPSGILQVTESEGTDPIIAGRYEAGNDSGCAYIVNTDAGSRLVVVSVLGGCAAYDAEGNDVTAETDAAVLDACKADAEAVLAPEYSEKKLLKLLPEGAEIEEINVDNCFNSIVAAYKVKADGAEYFAFVSCPYGYSNIPMCYFIVLDENGAIVKMNAVELILEKDYFSAYELDESAYKEAFIGLTSDDWTGDEALVSGATFTTGATRTALEDAFAVFAALHGGAEE